MNGAAQQQPEVQVPESEILKAIQTLEETTLRKGDTEPIPRGYMDSTDSARGGAATVIDGGPGSRHDLRPGGHEDPEHYDMGSTQGTRAEMGKAGYSNNPKDKKYKKDKKGKKEYGSDYDGDMDKSLRKAVDQRPTVKKAVEVSQFLEEITDAIVDNVDGLRKAVLGHYDEQSNFNGAIRKALIAYGNELLNLRKAVEHFGNAPVGEPRSVMSKSQLETRDFQGEGQVADHHAQTGRKISKSDVLDYLADRAEKGEIPIAAVTEFELTDRMPDHIAAETQSHFANVA